MYLLPFPLGREREAEAELSVGINPAQGSSPAPHPAPELLCNQLKVIMLIISLERLKLDLSFLRFGKIQENFVLPKVPFGFHFQGADLNLGELGDCVVGVIP